MSIDGPSPPNSNREWDSYIAGLRSGNPDSCRKFWEQFGESLKRVSERYLSSRLKSRIEADDVVQSACRTFFRRANKGEFLLDDDSQLWRLLCAITVTKARSMARFHSREKRSVHSEWSPTVDSSASQNLDQLPESKALPESGLILSEVFEATLKQFNSEEQQVIDMKLRDVENSEIAEALVCSERTVRRIVNRLQNALEDSLLVQDH